MIEIAGFNEGDTVKLTNRIDFDGNFYEEGEQNPTGIEGVVYGEDNAHDGRLLVKWDNGKSNSYLPKNLKLIKVEYTCVSCLSKSDVSIESHSDENVYIECECGERCEPSSSQEITDILKQTA